MTYDGAMWLMGGAIVVCLLLLAGLAALNWRDRPRCGRRRGVFVTRDDDPMFGRRAWSSRYDAVDRAMTRPIHRDMSVAPPWAKRRRR